MATTGIRLTAQSARELLNVKRESFYKSLGIIRQMCDAIIKDTSRRGKDNITFDIPPTVFAHESYDPKSMGRALAEQLYEDGFNVTGTTLHLNISWADDDDDSSEDEFRSLGVGSQAQAVPFTAAFSKQIRPTGQVAPKAAATTTTTTTRKGKKVEVCIGSSK